MEAHPEFRQQPDEFWAYVRKVSELLGYTQKRRRGAPASDKVPAVHSVEDIAECLRRIDLDSSVVESDQHVPTEFGCALENYFAYRSKVLAERVRPNLMDAERARNLFWEYHERLKPTCLLPMNKQKGEMAQPAFLTGLVNMLISECLDDHQEVNLDPRQLAVITRDGRPLKTLSRRVDGAFPSVTNPHALWEIKEYYYTTTFGSRVSGGVYETLLDGMELDDARDTHNVDIQHYLIIDGFKTWWHDGLSYLCRMIDMLHMGLVDEVIFGEEVVEAIPRIVGTWPRADQV